METKYQDSRVSQQAVKVTIGKVTTLPADSPATVKNVGTVNDIILEFGIPKGDQGFLGPQAPGIVGPKGDASTVPGPVGPEGRPGRNGLTAAEIEAVVEKALAESRAELKRAFDQEVATFKTTIDQLHEAIKRIL